MPPTATGVETTWTLLFLIAFVVGVLDLYDAVQDFRYWRGGKVDWRLGVVARRNVRDDFLGVISSGGGGVVGWNAMLAGPGARGFLPPQAAIYLLMAIPVFFIVFFVGNRLRRRALKRGQP